ncbi:winged helix DNA-binding domain-containing protein [Streptomyces sp. NPDC050504]|uniref:winged helix DNA-binding domain-containing protein n=1 Tax=Streptomyces sp. NPDC050504 TaxID=3365618 RepID=UPI003793B636
MTTPTATPRVLDARALNRATLDRQLLLRRADLSALDAVRQLVGLQAQNTKPPYFALAARLTDFDPMELSGLMASRDVARLVTLRSTIHTHTAEDCLALRALVQPVRERELKIFRTRLVGVDLDRLAAVSRELVEERPRPLKELRAELLALWPAADPSALTVAARCLLPLVQVTPRGLWGESGQVTLTTAERWFGTDAVPAASPDETVLRYLGAFGPASVKDMQTWCGLTRMREVFERLRPELLVFRDENGVELFDLPDAPRPDAAVPAPPRFLPEFDNVLLSHADRTRIVPPQYRDRIWTGNQSHPTFLVDGFLAGVWRTVEEGGVTTLEIEAFGELGRRERDALAEEGERTVSRMVTSGPTSVAFRAWRTAG